MNKYDKNISKTSLQKNIKKISNQINKDFLGKEIVMIVILTGAIFFATDLAKRIKIPIKIDFFLIKSHKHNFKSKDHNILLAPTIDIKGKDVLIVEDIVESGDTFKIVYDFIIKKKPNTISLATIFSLKKTECHNHYNLISKKPKGYLVGYGFDDKEYNRNLEYIGIIKDAYK